jgi:hypothetical protein
MLVSAFVLGSYFAKEWLLSHCNKSSQFRDVYLADIFVLSLTRPLGYLVAHIAYFGPIVLAVLYYWSSTVEVISRYGLGLVLILPAALAMSLDSESRHLVQFFALLTPFVIKVWDEKGLTSINLLPFCVLSLAWSKIWLSMNTWKDFSTPYFWQEGPWMTNYVYGWHALGAFVTGVIFLGISILHRPAENLQSAESGLTQSNHLHISQDMAA